MSRLMRLLKQQRKKSSKSTITKTCFHAILSSNLNQKKTAVPSMYNHVSLPAKTHQKYNTLYIGRYENSYHTISID